MIFEQKCISRYVLLTDQILLPYCLYFPKYWIITFIVIVCCPVCDVINLTIDFLSSHFSMALMYLISNVFNLPSTIKKYNKSYLKSWNDKNSCVNDLKYTTICHEPLYH